VRSTIDSFNIFVSAVETSGDELAYQLINRLLKKRNNISCTGFGGRQLKKINPEGIRSLPFYNVMGHLKIWKHLPEAFLIRRQTRKLLRKNKPDLAILVDGPGFNLRLAPLFKRFQIPVLYYSPPQTWAGPKHHLKALKKWIDLIIPLFSFEINHLKKAGLPVAEGALPRSFVLPSLPDSSKSCLALFPGSRPMEIKRHLPVMLRAAVKWKKLNPEISIIINVNPDLEKENYLSRLKKFAKAALNIRLVEKLNYKPDLAWCVSGSITLDLALASIPTVICYKTDFISWRIIKKISTSPYAAMPNILLNQTIFPELLQKSFHAQALVETSKQLLKRQNLKYNLKKEAQKLREILTKDRLKNPEDIIFRLCKKPQIPSHGQIHN